MRIPFDKACPARAEGAPALTPAVCPAQPTHAFREGGALAHAILLDEGDDGKWRWWELRVVKVLEMNGPTKLEVGDEFKMHHLKSRPAQNWSLKSLRSPW